MDIFLVVMKKVGMVWKKKEIKKDRRCIQVNYVTFKTDWPVEK